MKFKQYLTESKGSTSLEEILHLIKTKCPQYVKEWTRSCNVGKGTKQRRLLYSGRRTNKDFFIRGVRKDRIPTDMPDEAHEALDDEFDRQFSIKARSNSLFVTGSHSTADSYNDEVYIIFPMGKYKYIWSRKVIDLYSHTNDGEDLYIDEYEIDTEDIENNLMDEYQNQDDEYFEEEWEEYRDANWDNAVEVWKENREHEIKYEINSIVSTYTDRNLKGAIESNCEIMLNCNQYLAINDTIYGNILEEYFRYNDMKDLSPEALVKWVKEYKPRLERNKKVTRFINSELDTILNYIGNK